MAAQTEPEIILYDLACTKDVCFSPVVWRIRLMLNYKHVPYKTIFLEFPDIEPTLKQLYCPLELNPSSGLVPSESAGGKYTVPAIHHTPTNTYMMDSTPIAQFLESTYPDPPVPLKSELGSRIEAEARAIVGRAFSSSLMPREVHILAPRSQEFFRRTREAALGHRLEVLLEDPDKEEQTWASMDEKIRSTCELMLTHSAEGPFVLGEVPSYTDFFIAGSLQCARVIDEGVFQRMFKYSGYKEIYQACLPYMEKRN